MIDGGANESLILTPDNPEILSVQGMATLFCNVPEVNQITELKVVKDGDSTKQEAKLQRASEASESGEDNSSTTRDGASVLAS